MFLPLAIALFVWAILFLANNPTAEICNVNHRKLMGPDGPDDPFAPLPEQPPVLVVEDGGPTEPLGGR